MRFRVWTLFFLLLSLFALPRCVASTAVMESRFENPSPEPRRFGTSGPALTFLVLGDSTAAGQGADYEAGIAVQTAAALARTHAVTMINLARSGDTTADVVAHQLAAAETIRPDVVLLSVGANDVTHFVAGSTVRKNLKEIVDRLTRSNCAVRIVLTGSPDLGGARRIPLLLRPLAGARAKSTNKVFLAVAEEYGLTFAPIARETGLLFRRDPTLLAADRYHPNERGYATWIPVLNRAMSEAVAAPSRSCP